MICYRDMTYCIRKGCPRKSCPRNLMHVDWTHGLPVSVSDFWGGDSHCPSTAPGMLDLLCETDDTKEGNNND